MTLSSDTEGRVTRHRHKWGDSVHLEWLSDYSELLRCSCGRLWIRRKRR